jgi:hypothetical protein
VVALAGYADAGADVLGGAWEEIGGWDGLPELLWRVDRPETERLLKAVSEMLPDPATARAARKALLKHRRWTSNRN